LHDELGHVGCFRRVQPGDRFIQQDHPWAAHQGPCQLQPLLCELCRNKSTIKKLQLQNDLIDGLNNDLTSIYVTEIKFKAKK
ncbi:MAG: hypothetical protein SVR08_17275, partial [Spirochaetota bacterium]|nr:hypothetical protein [Spirochaetota bacterium]